MKALSIQTGLVLSILFLTHLNVYGASSKERALRLNAEINNAADERDASFKDAEKKARQAIREREEKLKRLKYEDPDEISSNAASSSVEVAATADAADQNEASKDENRLPASESKATPVAEEPAPVVVPEEAPPEVSKALISETVDQKAVESELQNYEGFATEEETMADTSAESDQPAVEVSKAVVSEETQVAEAKEEVQEEVKDLQEVKKSKKTKSAKADKKSKKYLAQKGKDKKTVAQKSSKGKKKLAQSQKSKKVSKMASNKKKKSSVKIAKSHSSKKVSRAPASFSSK